MNTTAYHIFPQSYCRCFIFLTDERPEQQVLGIFLLPLDEAGLRPSKCVHPQWLRHLNPTADVVEAMAAPGATIMRRVASRPKDPY